MTPTTSTASPHPDASRGPAGGGHTPGPWAVQHTIYEHMAVEIVAGDRGIALVWVGPNALHDGRLMRAAPDLYAALDEILDYRGGADSALHDPHVVDRARRALARATPSPGPAGADGAAAGRGA